MRTLAVLVALVIVGTLILLIYLAIRESKQERQEREKRAQDDAAWAFHHYVHEGQTVVTASKIVPETGEVLEEVVIERIPADDPDFSRKFEAASLEAQVRANELGRGGNIEQIRQEVADRNRRRQ